MSQELRRADTTNPDTLAFLHALRHASGSRIPLWGEAKVPPFLGVPLFYKAPPRHFQPPKCKLTPSKYKWGRRDLCNSIQKFADSRSPIPVWRVPIYILEAEIVLGVLYRKGDPQKGWYHGPRNYYLNNSQGNNSCNCNCNLAAKIII